MNTKKSKKDQKSGAIKKLNLTKSTVRSLTSPELAAVAGASMGTSTCPFPTGGCSNFC